MAGQLDIAGGYIAAGLSVIPVRADGSKAPAESGWRTYSDRRASPDELQNWWGNGHLYGIGIPGGPASGNLAVFDFETWAAYEKWLRSLPKSAEQRTRRCPLAKTGGGGAHLYARLEESVDHVILARHVVDGKPKILIEVRANGQQVVAPGSPPQCHPSGKPYEWMRESWAAGGTWSPVPWEDWFEWLDKAAALNEYTPPPEPAKADTRPRTRGGDSPGDDFNVNGTWEETGLLGGADPWKWSRHLGDDRGLITRPGKDAGTSATLGMVNATDGGHPLFFPFTTNCHPFEAMKGYSRFRVYAKLSHGDDWKAAAKALGERGYGDQSKGHRGSGVTFKGGTVPPNGGPVSPDPQPNPGTKPPLPLIYYADITPSLDAADFVEGLLIDGAMSVIYGESGCGKTFFALDLALHVAAGMSWRGREVDRRGVLYLALEGSFGIKNRIAAFKLAMMANAVELPFAIVPVALDLLSPDGDVLRVIEAAKLAAERLTIPVGLIVVDTLSRAMAGGNENSPEDMGALVRHIDLIRQSLPSHVAVVHHSGKDAARGARGHSLLRAATDTEIEVTRDIGTKTSTARATKQRELEFGDEFAFELVSVELGTNRRGKPVTSCVVRAEESVAVVVDRVLQKAMEKDRIKKKHEDAMSEEADNAVLDAIRGEHGVGLPGASRTTIRKRAKIKRDRVDEAIDRLLEAGSIIRAKPFEKPGGNGAKTPVTDGFAIAPKSGEGTLLDDGF